MIELWQVEHCRYVPPPETWRQRLWHAWNRLRRVPPVVLTVHTPVLRGRFRSQQEAVRFADRHGLEDYELRDERRAPVPARPRQAALTSA